MATEIQDPFNDLIQPLKSNRFYWVFEFLVFTLAYFFLSQMGHLLTVGPRAFATFWPPSGLLVAVLIRNDYRRWPIFIAGALVANLISGFWVQQITMPVILGFWMANILSSTLGAFLVRYFFGPRYWVSSLSRFLGLILLCCLPGPILGATLGSSIVDSHYLTAEYWQNWINWYTSELVGILIFAPLICNFLYSPKSFLSKNISGFKTLEVMAILALMAGMAQIVFGINESIPLGYLHFVLILWPGLRFGVGGVALTIMVFTVVAARNTALGLGLFGKGDLPLWEMMAVLKLLIGSCALSGYIVALTVKERKRALIELEKLNSNLETRINERTLDLFEEKQKFQNAFDDAPIGMALASTEGHFIAVNRAFADMIGYEAKELLNKHFLSLTHPEDQGDDSARFQSLLQQEKGYFQKEKRYLHKDGHSIHALTTLSSSKPVQEKKRVVIAQILDITQSRKDREKIRESEERFRQIAETIDEVFWSAPIDLKSNDYISPNYETIWGRSVNTLKENPWSFMTSILPEDREKATAAFAMKKQGVPFFVEYRISRPDGSIRFIWDRGYPVKGLDGTVLKYVGVAQDITDRKVAENLLSQSRQRLDLAMEQGNIGLWDWNLKTDEFFGTTTLLSMLGYSQGEVQLNIEWFESNVHPEDLPRIRQLLQEHLEKRTPRYLAEYRIKGKEGKWLWNISSGRVTEWDETGKPIRMLGTQTDTTPLKTMELALKESEKRFKTLADKAPVGIFLAGTQGEGIYVNDQYCQVTGTRNEDNLEFGWSLAIHPDDVQRVESTWKEAVSNQKEYFQEFRIIKPDGSIRHVISQAVPFHLDGGKTSNMVGTLSDITEARQAESLLKNINKQLEQNVQERTRELSSANEELAVVNEELAKSARHKDAFLASMSHELRTPLNGVLGISEALQEEVYGPVSPQQTTALRDIEQSGRHLLSLINDILDLAKMEAGKIALDPAPTGVQEICQASVRLIKQMVQKKQINLQMNMEKAPEVILADPRKLKQMLLNLLSNAVKFTPEKGYIGLDVIGDETAGVVKFTVWDTGIGIPADKIQLLFRPFQQIDNSLSRKYTGSGLGLALVRRMTDLHQGSVSVESQPDKGSRFTITLPWNKEEVDRLLIPTEASSLVPPQPLPESLGLASLEKTAAPPLVDAPETQLPLILMAEDNEINARTMRDFLILCGYRVEIAIDGFQAITMARDLQPKLILMDIQMPGMDGMEATRRLTADPQTRHIPIIAVTALAFQGDKELCLEAGAKEYLAKPVSLKNLNQVIKKWTS